jgi:hypothetical protein
VHLASHKRLAAFPSSYKQCHEGIDIQARDALRAPQRVPFDQELKGEDGLVLRDVHRIQRPGVHFGVGLFAARAAETEQSIPVFSEALATDIASLASHCFGGFCFANHDYNIQRALAVCQVENEESNGNKPGIV